MNDPVCACGCKGRYSLFERFGVESTFVWADGTRGAKPANVTYLKPEYSTGVSEFDADDLYDACCQLVFDHGPEGLTLADARERASRIWAIMCEPAPEPPDPTLEQQLPLPFPEADAPDPRIIPTIRGTRLGGRFA